MAAWFLDRHRRTVFGADTTRTIALSVDYVLRAPWGNIRDTLLHEIAHAIVGPGHVHDAVRQTAARRIGRTAKRCGTGTQSRKPWIRECPRCRDRWFRQRLTANARQRATCPWLRTRVAWTINAHGEGRRPRRRANRLAKTTSTI